MRAYCERQMVDFDSVVFSYDGQRLREDQTPGEVSTQDSGKPFELDYCCLLRKTLDSDCFVAFSH